jgi:S1-C subfamily serine protease
MTAELEPQPRTDPPPGSRSRSAAARLRRAVPFLCGVLATVVAIAAWNALNPPPAPLTGRDVRNEIASALASQTPGPPLSVAAYDAVRPSLVLIETDGGPTSEDPGGGLGTGVVVSLAGDILTANHVIRDATSIKLTFADGSVTGASVTSQQPDQDIAVLHPDQLPQGIAPATLGNPGAMRIGSDAFIVGNPFGLYGSMSAGVVSGLGRSYTDPETHRVIKGLIQVDAAVNPGNSGGPLLDRAGNVVGIVTALINPTNEDVFIGIGLAVPIDVAGGGAGMPPY